MKKYLVYAALFCGVLSYTSCSDYLDVIPAEADAEKNEWRDFDAARRYLYSCYSYMPNPRAGTGSLDLFTADEVITAFEHETFAHFPKGNYTASNTVISYWTTLFQGIRQCYNLLDNVDNVPGMEASDKQVYKAEATFLIAYYHYLLLRSYGPTMLIDGTIALNTSVADFPERRPYDECVQRIAGKFDEAIALGLLERQEGTDYGRATKAAALALKARMYLYAASPLFNGGKTHYTDADADDVSAALATKTTSDGTPLFNTTYDASKWQIAADATLAAITEAEGQGVKLYTAADAGDVASLLPNENQRAVRMAITDRNTKEIIWASTRQEGAYDFQHKTVPFNDNPTTGWNGVAPTWTMLNMFYTADGLPISADTNYPYRSNMMAYDGTQETENGTGNTLNFNIGREPRFYAWVSFHNGFYELQTKTNERSGGSTESKLLTKFRKNDNCGIKERKNNYSPTGYLNKKGVHPRYSRVNASLIQYPWPMIRLAELYLNYAEIKVEQNDLATAKVYLNKVRERAGIPTVEAAWAKVGKANLTQDEMRQIVRQERTIELYLENHRFWDVRRWLLGTKYFNVRHQGMNIEGTTDAAFFQLKEVNVTRKFNTPAHYLMPIPSTELEKSGKLVQNPGY